MKRNTLEINLSRDIDSKKFVVGKNSESMTKVRTSKHFATDFLKPNLALIQRREAVVMRESTVHATTSKSNTNIDKEHKEVPTRGRPILLRKCKSKSKEFLTILAKGVIPIAMGSGSAVPRKKVKKRSRRLHLNNRKHYSKSESGLRKRRVSSLHRCSRCGHSCCSRFGN